MGYIVFNYHECLFSTKFFTIEYMDLNDLLSWNTVRLNPYHFELLKK